MRITADLDLCQGHQACQLEVPAVLGFDAGADVVAVLDEHPPESERAAVERAVRYCPAMALTLAD